MVWNDKLNREIPDGWEVQNMKSFLSICNGKDHKDLEDGSIPVYGSGGQMRMVGKSLYEGESVLLPRKGSLGNFMYVNEEFWTVDTMFYSVPKFKGAAKYVYFGLPYIDVSRYTSGTGVPSMTSIAYYSMPLIAPNLNVMSRFDDLLEPLMATSRKNNREIEGLIKQRDELLPLLMNGQLSVRPSAVNCDLSHD